MGPSYPISSVIEESWRGLISAPIKIGFWVYVSCYLFNILKLLGIKSPEFMDII